MQYGFVIDQTLCIGCHACTVACKTEHDVPLGVDRTWVKYVEKGTWPVISGVITIVAGIVAYGLLAGVTTASVRDPAPDPERVPV